MNNKMSINTYLSTIESKQQTKQVSRPDRIIDMESVSMVAKWEGGLEECMKR